MIFIHSSEYSFRWIRMQFELKYPLNRCQLDNRKETKVLWIRMTWAESHNSDQCFNILLIRPGQIFQGARMTWARLDTRSAEGFLAEKWRSGADECSMEMPAWLCHQRVSTLKVVLPQPGQCWYLYTQLCSDAASSDQNQPEDHRTTTFWAVKT